jgi:hypothetical protein
MAISSTIEVAFAKQYSPRLYILSQQRMSKLAGKVRTEVVRGAKEAYFDRLGLAEGEAITTRHPPTPNNEIPNTRRRVAITGYHVNTYLDHLDKLKMMLDPQSDYARAQAMNLGREIDDRIIAAALGNASAGVDGGTTVAFEDDSQSINGDGTATTLGTLATAPGAGSVADISLAKMLLMMQIFNQLDVDPDIRKYWMVNPKTTMDMLNLTEVKSVDYNTVKVLVDGNVSSYMGFNWFWSNRVTKDTATETAYRSMAWAQDGIIFGTSEGIMNRVSEREDLSYTIQVYSRMVNGAVRLDGDKVHECLNKVA